MFQLGGGEKMVLHALHPLLTKHPSRIRSDHPNLKLPNHHVFFRCEQNPPFPSPQPADIKMRTTRDTTQAQARR